MSELEASEASRLKPAWYVMADAPDGPEGLFRADTEEEALAAFAKEQGVSLNDFEEIDVSRMECFDDVLEPTALQLHEAGFVVVCTRCSEEGCTDTGYETIRFVKTEPICDECMTLDDWRIVDPAKARQIENDMKSPYWDVIKRNDDLERNYLEQLINIIRVREKFQHPIPGDFIEEEGDIHRIGAITSIYGNSVTFIRSGPLFFLDDGTIQCDSRHDGGATLLPGPHVRRAFTRLSILGKKPSGTTEEIRVTAPVKVWRATID